MRAGRQQACGSGPDTCLISFSHLCTTTVVYHRRATTRSLSCTWRPPAWNTCALLLFSLAVSLRVHASAVGCRTPLQGMPGGPNRGMPVCLLLSAPLGPQVADKLRTSFEQIRAMEEGVAKVGGRAGRLFQRCSELGCSCSMGVLAGARAVSSQLCLCASPSLLPPSLFFLHIRSATTTTRCASGTVSWSAAWPRCRASRAGAPRRRSWTG